MRNNMSEIPTRGFEERCKLKPLPRTKIALALCAKCGGLHEFVLNRISIKTRMLHMSIQFFPPVSSKGVHRCNSSLPNA